MINGNLLLGTVAALAVGTTLLSMIALAWAARPRRPKGTDPDAFLPPVSILKPLKGLDEGLEENLRSFFQLDYPEYQLLFGVTDPLDPAISVVEGLLREFPDRDAKLIVGPTGYGLNPKVENMAALYPQRRHDVIVISDSNVKARPTYLRETVSLLAEPGVGLVTNLIAGTEESSLGAVLENLQLNGFIAGGMASAAVLGVTCVVGKSMVMPARVLDEVGGFGSVRNILAEDQVLGLKVRRAGYKVRLSPHVIDNVNRQRGLRWFLNRHSRWYKIRRRVAPLPFALEPTVSLGVVGLVWALSGDSGIAWSGLLVLSAVGIFRDAVQTRWLRGSWPKPRHLLLSPVKDLFLLPVWFAALVSDRIHWRGHSRHVGRLTRLRLTRMPRAVRRRMRRINRLRSRQQP